MKFAVIVNGNQGNLVHAVSDIDAIEQIIAEYKKVGVNVREIKVYSLSIEIGKPTD
jgi:hypothetical protein